MNSSDSPPAASFRCRKCNHAHARYIGQCKKCGAWNTLVEVGADGAMARESGVAYAQSAAQVGLADQPRIHTGLAEFDRVLGGGVVPGTIVLIGGNPGGGKTTLLTQAMGFVAEQEGLALYVTGEEQLEQVTARAHRLGVAEHERLLFLQEQDIDRIEDEARRVRPVAIVLDSAQALSCSTSDARRGTVSQVLAVTDRAVALAQSLRAGLFLICHITKDGSLAGPKQLEHAVDAVLEISLDGPAAVRLLRATKNRYGGTHEVGMFAMTPRGLTDVENPSAMLLKGRPQDVPGSALGVVAEDSRAIVCEIQALTRPARSPKGGGTISAVNIDSSRVEKIVAVLQSRAKMWKLAGLDIMVNVAGGMRIDDEGCDLPIALAIVSSACETPLPADLLAIGEIGLLGELRSVERMDLRLQEAAAVGLGQVVGAAASQELTDGCEESFGIKGVGCATLREALEAVLDDLEIETERSE